MGSIQLYFRPTDNVELLTSIFEAAALLQGPLAVQQLVINHPGDKALMTLHPQPVGSLGVAKLLQHEQVQSTLQLMKTDLMIFVRAVTLSMNPNVNITFTNAVDHNLHAQILLNNGPVEGTALYDFWRPFIQHISKIVKLLRPDQLALDSMFPLQKGKAEAFDSVMREMAATVGRLSGEVERQVAKVWEENRRLTKEMEEQDLQRRTAHTAEISASNEVLNTERQALVAARVEIDKKSALLDRRKSLEQSLAILDKDEAFKMSKSTTGKRVWVHIFVIAALVLLGVGVGFLGCPVVQGKLSAWYQATTFGVATMAFLGLIIYYIRYLSAWSNEHARVELQNWKMRLDFRRAHWLTEFIIEASGTDSSRAALTDPVLSSLSKGLFDPPVMGPTPQHPVDDVLQKVDKLTARYGPMEFRFDGSEKKKRKTEND